MSVATVRKWKFAQVNDKRFYFSNLLLTKLNNYKKDFGYKLKK